MKSLLYLVIFTFITFSSFSHDYYFAFSEMEYNVKSRKFELTLIVSTHDIEHWLQNKGLDVKELEDIQTDTVMQNKIGSNLLDGFSVVMNTLNIDFRSSGYEVKTNGLTEFYFSSSEIDIKSPISVTFDLLMDEYEQQQNKLTFIYNSKKQTFPFLYTNREQIIEF